jgi:hypothetical protein
VSWHHRVDSAVNTDGISIKIKLAIVPMTDAVPWQLFGELSEYGLDQLLVLAAARNGWYSGRRWHGRS